MKTRTLSAGIIILFLFFSGMASAQQEKGRGDMGGSGLSTSEYPSYTGGKEHYLADSPDYMAGKKHYLRNDPSSGTEKIGRGKEKIPASRDEITSAEEKNSEEQEKTQVQININVIPGDSSRETGIVYLPILRPKHHRDPGNPPPHVHPNPPQTGNFPPIVSGGFQQGTMNPR